jgi:hypothetical protein
MEQEPIEDSIDIDLVSRPQASWKQTWAQGSAKVRSMLLAILPKLAWSRLVSPPPAARASLVDAIPG